MRDVRAYLDGYTEKTAVLMVGGAAGARPYAAPAVPLTLADRLGGVIGTMGGKAYGVLKADVPVDTGKAFGKGNKGRLALYSTLLAAGIGEYAYAHSPTQTYIAPGAEDDAVLTGSAADQARAMQAVKARSEGKAKQNERLKAALAEKQQASKDAEVAAAAKAAKDLQTEKDKHPLSSYGKGLGIGALGGGALGAGASALYDRQHGQEINQGRAALAGVGGAAVGGAAGMAAQRYGPDILNRIRSIAGLPQVP